MDRRKVLKGAGLAAVAGTVASPAIAQAQPEIRWRMASAYPKSLDTLFGAGEMISKRVAQATDNKFQIQPFAAGEIVGALQTLDATQNGTVECSYTLSSFFIGKDPTFMFDTSVPWGMNVRQHNAWMYYGGGLELMREFMKDYNVFPIPAGQTGAQMGGWFRKEIKSIADLQGLKMRIAGMGGQIMAKLGVVPQVLAAGDIYPALERGTLDAVEFSGPHDDEKLGFVKVAQYYYYPGFWEGGAQPSLYVNMSKWNELAGQLQGHSRSGLRRSQRHVRRKIRCPERGCDPPARGPGRAVASLPARRDGAELQGSLQALRRDRGLQRQVQEGV